MTGLVLEGGAMRGMYTAGVLDTLMEHGIEADMVVGVSAGALFGVNFLSGQKGRVIRYNTRFNQDSDYLGLRPLLREGNIVSTEYAYERVPHELDPFDDAAFQASGVPFYAVVTNVHTGAPEYIHVKSVFAQMDVLRASGSMPFVSHAVEIGGEKYLDGGISDSVPFRWLASQGCNKIVVVLTRDLKYRKRSSGKGVEVYQLKYPAIAEQLRTRHRRYNESISELKRWERAGKAYVIRPSEPIEINSIESDPEKLRSVYDLGTRDCAAAIPGLEEYLR